MERVKENLADNVIADRLRNKWVVIGMTAINIILAAAYLIEWIKGARSLSSYLIVLTGCVVPIILYLIAYFKKKETKAVRYITTVAFCLLYGYIMYTTTKNLAFCYIILVFTLVTVYSDLKLSLSCSIYALVLNIVVAAKNALTVGLTETQITETEILLACILLAGLFSIAVTAITSKINNARIEQMNDEKEQLSALLATILRVSESMSSDVKEVSNEIQKLGHSILETENSMEDLTKEAKETAESIQTQQENTEEINLHISKVETVTKEIGIDIRKAEEVLAEGQTVMDSLIQQVIISETASNQVAKEMDELKNYTDKMQGIMALINNVASQTGMLALNASIEAARAGAAGRGFAVVAGEISNLASQTSSATGDINGLIGNISKSLLEVVKAVNSLLESNRMQNDYVNDTANNLKMINSTTDNVLQQSSQLEKVVQMVSKATEIITTSIRNVAATTESVASRATNTHVSSKENKISVETISYLVEHLNENAEELKTKQSN